MVLLAEAARSENHLSTSLAIGEDQTGNTHMVALDTARDNDSCCGHHDCSAHKGSMSPMPVVTPGLSSARVIRPQK